MSSELFFEVPSPTNLSVAQAGHVHEVEGGEVAAPAVHAEEVELRGREREGERERGEREGRVMERESVFVCVCVRE